MDKARREGVLTALESVRNRLGEPMALGYSCAGMVMAVGNGVEGLEPGDRVACGGGGYAVHAEVVSVPKNLVVKVPNTVDFESAAFTTLGAIALQGIRLADVKLGEVVVVIGLGLLGLLTVQMLKGAGCVVLGIDLQEQRAELARKLGADMATTSEEALKNAVLAATGGQGADAVLITADTKSNRPVELAGELARKKGVVVAVGAVGMNIPRKVYYEKELAFHVSCSYGPGRYDPQYEEKGIDYPYAYVRWTENRNMQAFIRLLAEGKVDVKPLITHRFPIGEAPKAYELIAGKTQEAFLGVLITYPDQPDLSRRVDLRPHTQDQERGRVLTPSTTEARRPVAVGLFGAGNFATATLLPAMRKVTDIEFVGVCTATGLSARHVGDKFKFRYCTTDEDEILNDPEINAVVIATPHHLHARQVLEALKAGKHVFCEKPLCIREEELAEIVRVYAALAMNRGDEGAMPSGAAPSRTPMLMVGYNRRFAPMAKEVKAFLADVQEPLVMHYRVNAAYIPLDHWVQDLKQSGGRIIGEVCHFVDLLSFLADAPPIRVYVRTLPDWGRYREDNVVITVEFADGSLGTITYVANGDKAFSKERVEVFGGGSVAVLDDFRHLELVRNGRRNVVKARLRQDKGHRGEWEAFVAALQNGGPSPIPFEEIVATTLATFRIVDSLRTGQPMAIDTQGFISGALANKQQDPDPQPKADVDTEAEEEQQ
ncbi:MAG: oxidoreductase [Gemmatimonadales bacterium]|nr:MAG: oxidoreductase [Gemmatimonadales bacterium]